MERFIQKIGRINEYIDIINNLKDDCNEPIHVHVERDNSIAKIWIDPIRLQSSGGFTRSEINNILSIIAENQIQLLEGWNEYFNN